VVDVVLDGTSPAGKFGEVEVLAVVVADELAVVDVTAVVLTGANGAVSASGLSLRSLTASGSAPRLS
jgi:hypothetical protein